MTARNKIEVLGLSLANTTWSNKLLQKRRPQLKAREKKRKEKKETRMFYQYQGT